MTKSLATALTAAALGMFPAVAPAAAQEPGPAPTRFGVQLSYGNDSEFGVGARVRYSLRGLFPTVPLSGIGMADVSFPGGGVTWIEANYNVVYDFDLPTAPRVAPYAGGGLNFVHLSTSAGDRNRFGLNGVAGIGFRGRGRVLPFLEIRGTIAGSEQLLVSGGILF